MEENTHKNVDNQTENLSESLENEKKEIVVNINRKYIRIALLSILFSFLTVAFLSLITISFGYKYKMWQTPESKKLREEYRAKINSDPKNFDMFYMEEIVGIFDFEVSSIFKDTRVEYLWVFDDNIPIEYYENNKLGIDIMVFLKYLFTGTMFLYYLLFAIAYAIILFIFRTYKFKIKT